MGCAAAAADQHNPMKPIPPERREAILARLSGPAREPVARVAAQEGISPATLYLWRRKARQSGALLPDHDDAPEGWSAREKFAAVLHCAGLSAHALSEYCRRNGLYPEQIERWRLACEQANATVPAREAGLQRLQRGDRDRIRHLESELRRKEKALAEAAALLVLQKKARAVWGEEDA